MAMSHELSGEIAAALFAARDRSPSERNDLKQVVLKIHSTLEELTKEEKKFRTARDNDLARARLVRVKSAGQDS